MGLPLTKAGVARRALGTRLRSAFSLPYRSRTPQGADTPSSDRFAAASPVVKVGRLAGQFARAAAGMDPSARTRSAERIAAEVRPFVAPIPPADAETFVRAVVALRRDREYAALQRTDERARALTGSAPDAPRGFPRG